MILEEKILAKKTLIFKKKNMGLDWGEIDQIFKEKKALGKIFKKILLGPRGKL